MLSHCLQALSVTLVVHNHRFIAPQLPVQRGSDGNSKCDVMPHLMMHLCSNTLAYSQIPCAVTSTGQLPHILEYPLEHCSIRLIGSSPAFSDAMPYSLI